jgi:S-DNA-T family DNA segregation ATPase FtsK/SpoIIIE
MRPPGEALAVGIGGDDAAPVEIGVGPGARIVVAGPAESGRTTALRRLAAGLEARGRAVRWLDADAPADAAAEPRPGGALVVDDADDLPAAAAECVARAWRARDGVVVAAVRSAALAAAFHGLAADLRGARTVLLLAPLHGGTAHLPPGDVLPHADPAHPRHPGRGVLVEPRRAVPVQVPGG